MSLLLVLVLLVLLALLGRYRQNLGEKVLRRDFDEVARHVPTQMTS